MGSTTKEIEDINQILPVLPEDAVREIRDFAFYLADRERRRKELVARVLKAEQEPPVRFESVEDAVKAVFDETED
jgi:hypothetical protein